MGAKVRGPFPLEASRIDILVIPKCPGVYGISNTANKPTYIARSDADLNTALKRWIGKYKFFWFCYAISPKEAYLLECKAYHRHLNSKLENEIHPEAPENIKLACPICGTK